MTSHGRVNQPARHRLSRACVLATVVLSLVAPFTVTAARAVEPADPALRGTIEEVVRDYLKQHPEVVGEALQALQARQREEQRVRARGAIGALRKELVEDQNSPVGGNGAGDVTVVEFFDYRCTYCRGVETTVRKLLDDDRNVRLVYKELPILGPDSVTAAKAALAARVQGKYEPFHSALMATPQPVTAPQVFEIATRTGLDVEKLKTDMESPAVREAIERTYRLAQALGITGTPSFVIGEELAVGALELTRFKELVGKARAR